LDVPDVLADHTYLVRVLDCLIDNACRYTPSGRQITISAEAQDKYVRISVSDTGIGIDPQDQNRIFTRFFRATTSDVGPYEGVGLSLDLAKSFVERMGGTIGFESEPGKGSTFWFTLPIATANE
jgi:signal transduction histidine kinase